jgi:hypothetical protein
MATERKRLLTLALENLENQRTLIDAEIAELTRELRGSIPRKVQPVSTKPVAKEKTARKRRRLTKEERTRRSQRMTAYWDNWRKQRNKQK